MDPRYFELLLGTESMPKRQRRVRKELLTEGVEADCARGPIQQRGVTHLFPSAELQKKALKTCLAKLVKKRVYCELAAEALLQELVHTVQMPARVERANAQAFYAKNNTPFSLARFQKAFKAEHAADERVYVTYARAMASCRQRQTLGGLRRVR